MLYHPDTGPLPAPARTLVNATGTRRLSAGSSAGGVDWFFRAFLKVFVWSNLWIAAGLASLTLFTSHVLGLSGGWDPFLVVFASGLFIYGLDHYRDARAGEVADPEMAAYFLHPVNRGVIALSGVVAIALVVRAPPAAWVVFGAYLGVGFLYSGAALFPGRRDGRWCRVPLKEVLGLKSWLVGGAMTTAAVGLPMAWEHRLPDNAAWNITLFLFVYCASNAHMFDVRDIETDRITGVASHPVRRGERRTRQMLVLLNLVMLAVMFWGWASGQTTAHPEILVTSAVTVLYVLLVRSDGPREVFDIFVDGCFYLPALLATAHDALR